MRATALSTVDAQPPHVDDTSLSAAQLVQSNLYLQVVLLNVALYSACFAMQTPLLPTLIQTFDGDAVVLYGSLQTFFAVLQLLGGLVCGPLFDVIGPRAGLVLSFLASAATYGGAACATSLAMLFVSRVPTVLQHAALASRIAVIGSSTSISTKSSLLGYLGLAASLGSIAGPVLGGAVSDHFSLRAAMLVAAWLSLLSAALSLLMSSGSRESSSPVVNSPSRKLSFADLVRVAVLPGVPSLLAAKSVLSFAVALYYSSWPLVASVRFGMTPAEVGALISVLGMVTVVTQAVVIDAALSVFSPTAVWRSSLITLILSFCGLATATSVGGVTLWLIPTTAAACIMSVVCFTAARWGSLH